MDVRIRVSVTISITAVGVHCKIREHDQSRYPLRAQPRIYQPLLPSRPPMLKSGVPRGRGRGARPLGCLCLGCSRVFNRLHHVNDLGHHRTVSVTVVDAVSLVVGLSELANGSDVASGRVGIPKSAVQDFGNS
jgi:hypothetical protein